MKDINSFKNINDNYGHSEGDRALVEVASVLDVLARENGYSSYRYGGDEFTILVDSNEEEKIVEFCKNIDVRIAEHNEELNAPYLLQVSSGFSIYDEDNMATIPDIIEEADKRMYEDKELKRKGR